MGVLPGGEEVGLFGGEAGGERLEEGEDDVEQGAEERWWARRKGSGWMEGHFGGRRDGGFNDHGETDGRDEGDNGEDKEGEGANAPDISKGISAVFCVNFGVVAKIDLADPGRAIEEKGEPALTFVSVANGRESLNLEPYRSMPKIGPSRLTGSGLAGSWLF